MTANRKEIQIKKPGTAPGEEILEKITVESSSAMGALEKHFHEFFTCIRTREQTTCNMNMTLGEDISCHMGTARATPELRAVVDRLAEEYRLPVNVPGLRRPPRRFGGSGKTPQQMESDLVALLEALTPGLYLIVEHPGLDTPEMRAIGHKGYYDVAAHRVGVTHAFTSEKVKAVVKRRGIQLISYADALKK